MTTEKIFNSGALSGTINASSNLVGGNINTFTKETDPTVPDYIKEISKEDIAGWDNNAVVNEEQNKTLVDLETYIDIVTPKNTASGELVHITDSLPLPIFETTADGNVEQETTTGKNMIKMKNGTITINGLTITIEDGTITLNGTVTANSIYKLTNGIESAISTAATQEWLNESVIEDKNNTTLSINYLSGSGNTDGCAFRIYGNDTTHITQLYPLAKNQNITFNDVGRISCLCFFTNASRTFTNYKFAIQLENGPEVTDFEKPTFGASPNPEYPQEIEVLGAYNLAQTENGSLWDGNGADRDLSNSIRTKFIDINVNRTITPSIFTNLETRYLQYILYDSNKTFISLNNFVNNLPITIDNQNAKYIRFKITGPVNGNMTIDDIKFNVVKGTEVKPYLPYGCVGVKVNGKNLCNAISQGFYLTSTVINFGVTTADSGLCIKVDGKSSYTISTIDTQTRYRVAFTKVNPLEVSEGGCFDGVNLDNSNSSATKSSVGYNYLIVNATDLTKIQIEKGSVATPYEPYKEQIVYLDLKDNWVGAINDDIKDYLITDKKKFWLVKNVGKVVLDGSEDWILSSNGNYYYYNNNDLPRASSDSVVYSMLSNYYIAKTYGEVFNAQVDYGIALGYTNNRLYIRNKDITSVSDFKIWLGSNNTIVYYLLAEPQIIELGELPEPIKTFEGVNNIQLLANLDTEIEVKYALDVKKYADDKYLELTNALVSTGANL